MRRDDIKAIVKEVGPRGFVQTLAECLQGRDAVGTAVPKLRAETVSVRALWEGLVGPCEETLPSYQRAGAFSYVELQEAVDSTMFPSATGVLIASKVIEAYDAVPAIGDQLVTVMPSKLKSERIVGFTSLEGPQEVPEGMPYQESGLSEKYVTTETAKKGRILEITEEAIFFDQTGQILLRAQRLGEATREERELIILGGVVDVAGATDITVSGVKFRSVYRPSGTAAALYAAGNTNYLATATPLVDWTDIDEVFQYHAENMRDDRPVSAERLPVLWNPRIILTGRKLAGTTARILSATEQRSGDITSGTGSQLISGNPLNGIAPGLKALSSPFLDYLAALSGSAYDDSDDWFFGDPQKQFVWQEIWPLQTLRSRQDDEAQFRRDVVARYKVRYFGGIAAIDTKQFLKINAV